MLLVAYLTAAAAVLWRLRAPGTLRPAAEAAIRAGAVLVGAAAVAVALALLAKHEATPLGTAILVSLAAGASCYVAGTLGWTGRGAFRLRAAGWTAMVLALLVPTTLSLALPLVALLAVTLHVRPQALTP
jgi:hypothetical protein